MLPHSCALGLERRNRCAFQPMLMSRAPRSAGWPAAEFVELSPEAASLLLGWLRRCTRKANPEISSSVGMQPPKGIPAFQGWPLSPSSSSLTFVIDKGLAPWLGWPESQAEDLASPGDAAIMPTQSERPVAVSGTPSKTVALLRKQLRQLLRVVIVLAVCVAVAALVLAIWCSTA
jgi:hypothetical protein